MNFGNIGTLFKLRSLWAKFAGEHPKFPAFVSAVQRTGVGVGDVLGLSVTKADGTVLETNLRITESDLELLNELKNIKE